MPDRVTLDAAGGVTLLGRRGTDGEDRRPAGESRGSVRPAAAAAGGRRAWVGLSAGDEPALRAVVATERRGRNCAPPCSGRHGGVEDPEENGSTVTALPINARGKADTRALQAMCF